MSAPNGIPIQIDIDHDIAAYMRVVSLAIAFYEYRPICLGSLTPLTLSRSYLETFPSAWRFYRFQFRERWTSRRLTFVVPANFSWRVIPDREPFNMKACVHSFYADPVRGMWRSECFSH